MVNDSMLQEIYNGLKSHDSQEMLKACAMARELSKELDSSQVEELADGLTSLFYAPAPELPDYAHILRCATDALVEIGPRAVGVLIRELTDGDPDANLLVARTLAKMGRPAAIELVREFNQNPDPYHRSIALFAMSLMDDPILLEVFPDIIGALDHDHPEVRDAAARALGKIFDCFEKACLDKEHSDLAFEKLMKRLSDSHAGARSKAVQSIGIMGRSGLLDDDQRARAITAIEAILGVDGRHDWDKAFIVRREAEEEYTHITGWKIRVTGPCQKCRKGPEITLEDSQPS
jgi:HEAT repeat protein